MINFYRMSDLNKAREAGLLLVAQKIISPEIKDIKLEHCYNVEVREELTDEEMKVLHWLLSETFESQKFSDRPFLYVNYTLDESRLIEFGPLMNFATAWNTGVVSACHSCGLRKIVRIERSCRILIQSSVEMDPEKLSKFKSMLYDRMTEGIYSETLTTFDSGRKPEPVFEVPLLEEGKTALEEINKKMGLGLDPSDIEYYYNLFVNDIGRNPTNVECFDLGQSNSEHSRHWFFKGRIFIDGMEMPFTLMDIVQGPHKKNPGNSVIAFNDNSSSIRGYKIVTIIPEKPGQPSRFIKVSCDYDIIFTAETHNFPSGIAPFPGAETGAGGRLRDIQGTGRGGLVVAGSAGYCVGNLRIPGYKLSWEDDSFVYPRNMASPLDIEIQASNGASDYGNKFGEPLIQGFTHSFGMRLPNGERYEWLKPIMFTGGIGQMNHGHVKKGAPEKGMLVVKVGGPAYRIGIGGGAASSMIQGANSEALDFNAVQRGDAEMEQKMNRVIRACIEMGEKNPIVSVHDQGAGGLGNVVKEIIYPAGARIDIRKVTSGDPTLSVLELWGGEHQESNTLLIHADRKKEFKEICEREKVNCDFIGEITGEGKIVVYDSDNVSVPVNLSLEKISGEMPQKKFEMKRIASQLKQLELPKDLSVMDALNQVLRLVSVGSKRFLTSKVDRSVGGLVARQQCCGPLQLPISDVAVVAQSHYDLTGAAMAIGERPIHTLLNPLAMGRMSVSEALTNIVWAGGIKLEDIKCSGNWMWAGKQPGEGAKMYDAGIAMSDFMIALGIAVDGGKDSLSMATLVVDSTGKTEMVKSPGALVISAYVTIPDITKVVTPDIKKPGESVLVFIDLSGGKMRLGGSALAQVHNQVGDECPDVDPELSKRGFNVIQELIQKDLILSGHDRSDGGLITTLLEMAFAGNCGLHIRPYLSSCAQIIPYLFNEESGVVVEVETSKFNSFMKVIKDRGLFNSQVTIAATNKDKTIKVVVPGIRKVDRVVLSERMHVLREIWEETGHQLNMLQTNPECAKEEKRVNFDRKGSKYFLSFMPKQTSGAYMYAPNKHKVAILREEGSNSDREMTSAFDQAGFEPWDITMTDLLEGRVNLKDFRGLAFVGGFSYADVLDSAKGWAGTILFKLKEMFDDFYNREDTFSLGVCNGCQLMALLGWVPWQGIPTEEQPRFIKNLSGRFESRFPAVKILPSPAIMLRGMAGSVLGVCSAHGEGRLYFPDSKIIESTKMRHLMPIRYVDDDSNITQVYPFNPSGSSLGVAAICSPDGRHLAIMPHPERTFLSWQWHYMPEEMKEEIEASLDLQWHDRPIEERQIEELKISPWLKLFQNAREWCDRS